MSETNLTEIKRSDLLISTPKADETLLIVQRHEKYQTDPEKADAGSLTEEGREKARSQTEELLKELLGKLSPEEQKTLDLMVIASPTQYAGKGQRSLETASIVLETINSVYGSHHLNSSQILNNDPRLIWKGGPIPSQRIVEPKMFTHQPEFSDWLKQTFGGGKMNPNAWIAFEADEEPVHTKRLEAGAEGPIEMADRLAAFLYAMKLYSNKYHQTHPGRRLLIWSVSHYDTISPYLKTRLKGGDKEHLPVDYGAGFGITITKEGSATTTIGGISYPVSLDKASTASSID